VDARDEAADPFQGLRVAELGRAPAAARVHGEAEAFVVAGMLRRDHGHLRGKQIF
jgi:hypothetical protein